MVDAQITSLTVDKSSLMRGGVDSINATFTIQNNKYSNFGLKYYFLGVVTPKLTPDVSYRTGYVWVDFPMPQTNPPTRLSGSWSWKGKVCDPDSTETQLRCVTLLLPPGGYTLHFVVAKSGSANPRPDELTIVSYGSAYDVVIYDAPLSLIAYNIPDEFMIYGVTDLLFELQNVTPQPIDATIHMSLTQIREDGYFHLATREMDVMLNPNETKTFVYPFQIPAHTPSYPAVFEFAITNCVEFLGGVSIKKDVYTKDIYPPTPPQPIDVDFGVSIYDVLMPSKTIIKGGKVYATFILENTSTDSQRAYLTAMCRPTGQPEFMLPTVSVNVPEYNPTVSGGDIYSITAPTGSPDEEGTCGACMIYSPTGTWVKVHADTTGLSEDDVIRISGTSSYNGVHRIFDLNLGDGTFKIATWFKGSQEGTWEKQYSSVAKDWMWDTSLPIGEWLPPAGDYNLEFMAFTSDTFNYRLDDYGYEIVTLLPAPNTIDLTSNYCLKNKSNDQLGVKTIWGVGQTAIKEQSDVLDPQATKCYTETEGVVILPGSYQFWLEMHVLTASGYTLADRKTSTLAIP